MRIKTYNRREFVKAASLTIAGAGVLHHSLLQARLLVAPAGKRIGVIGLDTSHSEVFTRMINTGGAEMHGYRVVAAYHPMTNRDILNIKPQMAAAVQKQGARLVNSMDELLDACDVVLLETIDGVPHLEQALPVLKAGKPVFIDKPLSATLDGAKAIVAAAEKYKTPFFSSSSLRFDENVQKVVAGSIGRVTGVDVFTPAEMEPSHLDMAWYALHGLEMLYAVLGRGCTSVTRLYEEDTDVIIGTWEDGRMGTVRGVRKWPAGIAGTAFGEKGTAPLGPFSEATYKQLIGQIIQFFDSKVPPVSAAETLELFAFMQAADESRRNQGRSVSVASLLTNNER
ncbi:Gfo/Idh/MocA family oxidoreductase [Parapedobacter defluvii]|uniref:Gfo/Idh/MocA family protein n=1 Tax=Parapedobacter defluvii TaxID=2045106 RepID=UPI00333F135C